MKILLFFSCALAASASAAYYGPQHIPVIGPNGVPIEPLEVQAARSNHLAALASAHSKAARNPYYYESDDDGSLPFTAYSVPTLLENHLPLETHDVAAARLQHFRDFAVAAERNGVHSHPLLSSAPLVAAAAAYPVDTPEVQLAKAAHFQAHAEAAARAGPLTFYHSRKRRSVYGGYHIPVIGPNGVPVETPEVQAAKANHLAALAQANSRPRTDYYSQHSEYNAVPYTEPSYQRYWGPEASIGPDGQPLETPEVKAAKQYHFAAHAAVLSGAGHLAGPRHYY